MKKNLLGLFAVVVAIALSAFTMQKEVPSKAGEVWFDFTGTLTSQYSDLSKYSLDPNNSPDCPNISTFRCEIKAQPSADDETKPDLSTIIDEKFRVQ